MKYIAEIIIALCAALITTALLYSAPAPLPKRTKPEPLDMSGEWILTFNGSEWKVLLTRTSEFMGDYRAVSPTSGLVWCGYWSRTRWDDVFMICEKVENSRGSYSSFPVRYDGEVLKIPRGIDGGDRGIDWVWDYGGSTVVMRRVDR